MDNLFTLMLLYLTYTALSFWIFNFNFLSPSFVFSLSLSVMLCLAYYTANNLGMLFAINLQTFSIFAFAGFLFLATEFSFYSFHSFNHIRKSINIPEKSNYPPLLIHPQIQWAFTAFLAMSLFLAVIVFYINTGGGSWSQRMTAYKEMLLYYSEKLRMRFIMAQIYKVNIVAIDLFEYVLIYNLSVCKVPLKNLISYILDALLYIVYSAVTTGARQTSVEAVLFLVMIYISLNISPKQKKKLWRFLFRSIPVVIILASFFTYYVLMKDVLSTSKFIYAVISTIAFIFLLTIGTIVNAS